jgi:hypothetical protein
MAIGRYAKRFVLFLCFSLLLFGACVKGPPGNEAGASKMISPEDAWSTAQALFADLVFSGPHVEPHEENSRKCHGTDHNIQAMVMFNLADNDDEQHNGSNDKPISACQYTTEHDSHSIGTIFSGEVEGDH